MKSVKSRLLSILFWSVISAAFIGPGTLTSASSAGASFGFQLVWALVFATVACIVLQEMAARITIATGSEIGQTLKQLNGGVAKLVYFITFGVILGCAAYEAGNILGAIEGIRLLIDVDKQVLTLVIGLICGMLLWWGTVKILANILGMVVAIMGIAFIYVALEVEVDKAEIVRGLIPTIPDGSEWLVLGLIGTTIVPYNLFLGSGLSKGQAIGTMRFGLSVSIVLGGLVSIAILVAGAQINGEMSFYNLALVMGEKLGSWAKMMLAFGLFAAGFTSSITAPLAAGILAKSVVPHKGRAIYKWVWLVVLITGLGFGIAEVKPIPIIIAAQAMNGMILPVVALLLIVQANNAKLMGNYINSMPLNILAIFILDFVLIIGVNNIFKAVYSALGQELTNDLSRLTVMQLIAMPVILFTVMKIVRSRQR
ncbi:Nramp family divalent metal transporter [Fulvivirga sp. 29W222]|uniref:Nramp family divalent metal transporter n=1 Tax=Fulvivirga marina TaxID=2494733 RepID=A0A937KAA5_9BACT|nr:Nramp family divalent metal transporter [Fulvivirga marina]MBL6444991.1 Nramp family divalent metal transporter [Fulvivirga marina]